MVATRPPLRVLDGRFIRLEPMTEEHLPELFEALNDPLVYEAGYAGGIAGMRSTVREFREFARDYYPWDTGNVYAARITAGENSGVLVGTSTLSDFVESNEHAHIGWTAWDPRVWGTAVNPEAKLLMLDEAFEHGFGRVKIQTDVINTRSRAAILKLGATLEGITRRDRRRADGTWRDTIAYSILIEEWPAVRTGIEVRLAGFAPTGVVFTSARANHEQ